jgi:hypothetical protein
MLLKIEVDEDEEDGFFDWQGSSVVAVDYDNYAIVRTCEKQYMGFWAKESHLLLTRELNFDRKLVADKLNELKQAGYPQLPTLVNQTLIHCNSNYLI